MYRVRVGMLGLLCCIVSGSLFATNAERFGLWPDTIENPDQLVGAMLVADGIPSDAVTFWQDVVAAPLARVIDVDEKDLDRLTYALKQDVVRGFVSPFNLAEKLQSRIAHLRQRRRVKASGSGRPKFESFYPQAGSRRNNKRNQVLELMVELQYLDETLDLDLVSLPLNKLSEKGCCLMCSATDEDVYENACGCSQELVFCRTCMVELLLKFVDVALVESWQAGVASASFSFRLRIPHCPYCKTLYYPFKKERESFGRKLPFTKRKAVVVHEISKILSNLTPERKLVSFLERLIQSNVAYKKIIIRDEREQLLSPGLIALQIFHADARMHEGIGKSFKYDTVWAR